MRTKRKILLVEDDTVDQKTVQRALNDIHISNEMVIANNGEEALLYLRNMENDAPGIILLDLNMPRMNGIEFLKIIKIDEELKKIPVVVLTTSNEEWDRVESFKLSVAGYMTKPVDYLQFVEIVKSINWYWTISETPFE